MRKYIKPELDIISFKVKADVMSPTTIPVPTVGSYVSNAVSEGNTYIQEFSNRAWTSVDGKDWNWSN